MAQLGSPGVQVNVIDESFYNPATPGTIPLVVLATAQDKTNASGTGVAPGTQKVNANSLYLATSQKDLTDRFGVPVFQKDSSGNAIQGSELNEYGLFATYSYLGASNSAYVLRADVDLNALVGRATAPVGNPAGGSYWIDTSSTRFGVFEWNNTLQQFTNKTALVLNSETDVEDTIDYKPKASIGSIGSYAVVTYSASGTPNDSNTMWFKNSDNAWVKVGSKNNTSFGSGASNFTSGDWTASWPAVTSKAFDYVNVNDTKTFTNVPGVYAVGQTGTGSGARFNVVRTGTEYTSVTVYSTGVGPDHHVGSGYANGEIIKIKGSVLGGVDGTNDITVTLHSVSESGYLFDGNVDQYTAQPAVATSDYGFTIRVAPYDRSAPVATVNYLLNGGSAGAVNAIEASPEEIASDLNLKLATAGVTKVAVRVRNSKLEFIAKDNYYVELSHTGNGVQEVLADAGSDATAIAASALGIAEGTYNAPAVEFGAHTKIPFWATGDENSDGYNSERPSGSVWIKTTEYNLGARWAVKRFNGDTQIYETKTAPVYTSTEAALVGIDPLGGGTSIPVGTLFVNANYEANDDVNFKVMTRLGSGSTVGFGVVAGTFSSATETITIAETVAGSSTLNAITFTTDGATVEEFLAQITDVSNYASGTGLVNVAATYDSVTKKFTLTHKLGGEIYIVGASWDDLGFSTANTNVYAAPTGGDYTGGYRISNWQALSVGGYVVDNTQPTDTPTDGTLWYASYQNQVDIMVHNGTKWVGYNNYVTGANPTGPFVQATKPTEQSDGTALVEGDLWVDTSVQDDYGHTIKRWNNRSKTWDAVVTTDHTSQYGIIYADARWSTAGANSTAASIVDLLTSNYVDFDCPDPTAYPRGMLLWNTRRSGFNIKKYVKNYVNTNDSNVRYQDPLNPGVDEDMANYFADRWVSVSGQDLNQVAYFGRKAQRAYVVGQLKVAINTNQRILDEDNIFFNLIACPGYPELITDMVNLNSSRNGTALVVGDTPLRLPSDAQSLVNYGTDYYNTGVDGEAGLHTNSDHLAVYYPAGLTTDLSGTNVVVPASHMMLRTIAVSDQRSFQWFAPAGTRRGGITNATSVGYLKDGSFVPTSLNQGVRDQMATIKVNPITNVPGAGLVAFGQYTKTGVNSSLDRINVARLVSYLRRQLGIITKPFLFEPNDKQTRSEIKNVCESLMLDLVSLRGIYDFIVVCDETNNTSSVISNNQLYVDIAVEPVKAVEFIYIPLRLKNVGDIKARQ